VFLAEVLETPLEAEGRLWECLVQRSIPGGAWGSWVGEWDEGLNFGAGRRFGAPEKTL